MSKIPLNSCNLEFICYLSGIWDKRGGPTGTSMVVVIVELPMESSGLSTFFYNSITRHFRPMHLSLTISSDEERIQKHNVLYWAKGTGNAIQNEQNSISVQAEMRDNARKVHRKIRAGSYCISENGQEVPDAATRD